MKSRLLTVSAIAKDIVRSHILGHALFDYIISSIMKCDAQSCGELKVLTEDDNETVSVSSYMSSKLVYPKSPKISLMLMHADSG